MSPGSRSRGTGCGRRSDESRSAVRPAAGRPARSAGPAPPARPPGWPATAAICAERRHFCEAAAMRCSCTGEQPGPKCSNATSKPLRCTTAASYNRRQESETATGRVMNGARVAVVGAWRVGAAVGAARPLAGSAGLGLPAGVGDAAGVAVCRTPRWPRVCRACTCVYELTILYVP